MKNLQNDARRGNRRMSAREEASSRVCSGGHGGSTCTNDTPMRKIIDLTMHRQNWISENKGSVNINKLTTRLKVDHLTQWQHDWKPRVSLIYFTEMRKTIRALVYNNIYRLSRTILSKPSMESRACSEECARDAAGIARAFWNKRQYTTRYWCGGVKRICASNA